MSDTLHPIEPAVAPTPSAPSPSAPSPSAPSPSAASPSAASPSAATPSDAPAADERPRLRDTWPLDRRDWLHLGLAYVVLTAVFVGIGELITGPLDGSAITDWDQRVSEWFVDQRTPTLNTWTEYGSLLADTFVKIGVTALAVIIMLVVLRRFREPVLIAVSLILEASVFITVTVIVGRPRPDVRRLEQSPVDSSFPSGHVAAAVAYTAIAIAIFWTVRNVAVRTATVFLVVAIPIIVAFSRVYRGMHFTTDVLFGALLGGAAVTCTWLVLREPDDRAAPASRR